MIYIILYFSSLIDVMDQLFNFGDNKPNQNNGTFDIFSALKQMPSLPTTTPKQEKKKE